MAALRGVARGSAAAPHRPALVKALRRVSTQQQLVSKAAQKPELARVETLGHSSHVSPNRKDGPSGSPRGGGTFDRTSRRPRHETPQLPSANKLLLKNAGLACELTADSECRGALRRD